MAQPNRPDIADNGSQHACMIWQAILFKPTIAAIIVALLLLAASGAADARGGHGFGGHGFGRDGGVGRHAARFADDRRHADDPYTKAALKEEEKLLAKLKNICRGC